MASRERETDKGKRAFKYQGAVVSDYGSKPEVLSRIAQATAAFTKLKEREIIKYLLDQR